MSNLLSDVKQGDSVDLSYGVKPAEDMTGWTCQVMVKVNKADSALIDQNLTDLSADTLRRVGILDTATLTPGSYWILAELYNATTGQRGEIHETLTITEQGVF